MGYTSTLRDVLSGYLFDGTLEENVIRPLPLGRKNYLFAGSHKAAWRAGMAYPLLGTV
jgi:transposase